MSTLPSQRQLRVGELVRHALADILSRGNVSDPDLDGKIVTVPEVRMTPDLKIATVYVMPLGGGDAARIVKALARNARWFRGELAKRLRDLRSMPDLRFRFDDRFEEASRIDALLHDPKVARDLAGRPDRDGEGET
jgi:ribosome-binding factor A